MNKIELIAKIEAMKAKKAQAQEEVVQKIVMPIEDVHAPATPPTLDIIPDTLKNLLGITETIEESNDISEMALMKASEQVERCRAYIVYLNSILPILQAKTTAMIEAAHKPTPIRINNFANFQNN